MAAARVEASFQQFPLAEAMFSLKSGNSTGEDESWLTVAELDDLRVDEEFCPPVVGFAADEPPGESEGPRCVDEGAVLVQADEVKLKAQPQTGRCDLRIYPAVIMTTAVRWDVVADSAAELWRQVGAVLANVGVHRGERRLLLLADGARWIRGWFEGLPLPGKTMMVCWYHLAKRCGESLSRACRGKQHRNEILRGLLNLLCEGTVAEALAYLDSHRESMKSSQGASPSRLIDQNSD